ncbi:dTMP kinase [Gardnerella vaginalis]|uniref:dTMP kinase n=1 Tax=Gardnerella vaginalis TaxID=2702 RepID=UPI000C7C3CCB|nr:dTMP kinase [Gardnerella vaginalis]PKZ52663.1 dTMP kinase [Gardnerella vaginalis]PKZ55253.1 dTMP kinase [Gardnerella vaginalis]
MTIGLKNSGLSGLNKGLFISFEGIDGVGKTTQVEALRDFLQARGLEVVVTREPGGTPLGEQLRNILLHGGAISARTEALLFAADRAQHAAQIIIPALRRGAVVITDRYIDSSLAYQSGGRELTMQDVRDLSEWASNRLWPDRTYLLDMSEKDAFVRLHGQADRMESAGFDFAQRTREAFLDLAKQNAQRFCVLDATLPACDLSKLIAKDVCELLDNAGIGGEKSPESPESPEN